MNADKLSLAMQLGSASPAMLARVQRLLSADVKTLAAVDAALDGRTPVAAPGGGNPTLTITKPQAARMIGVSISTVIRMMRSGAIKTVVVCGRNRILAASVYEYIEARQRAA